MWIDSHCHVTRRRVRRRSRRRCSRAREQAGVEAFVAIGAGYGVDAQRARGRARGGRPARLRDASASTRTTPRQLDDAGRAQLRALARPRRAWSPSASAASTTTTCTRRARCSARCSPSRSRWRASATCRSRSTCAATAQGAFEELLDIWRAEGRGELEGVLHCYTGTLDFARRALDARPRRLVLRHPHLQAATAALREVAAALPLDRLLVETDAPLLAPEGLRGRRNEPALGRAAWAQALARVQQPPLEEVARGHHAQRAPPVPPARAGSAAGMSETDDGARARRAPRARAPARSSASATRRTFEIGTKSAPIDLVTEVDHACEALIVETLRARAPGRRGARRGGRRRSDRAGAAWRWIIDPLDGTTNYAHGYPRFCVSIGVEQRRRAQRRRRLRPAARRALRRRARRAAPSCNGRRSAGLARRRELGRALLATGFAYDVRHNPDDNLDHFARFVKNARARAPRRERRARPLLRRGGPLRRLLGAAAPPLGRRRGRPDRRGGGRPRQRPRGRRRRRARAATPWRATAASTTRCSRCSAR